MRSSPNAPLSRGPWCTCQRSGCLGTAGVHGVFQQPGPKLYETHYLSIWDSKNVWKISSLSFTMIDHPRLHSSSICSVVWNGCLTFSASWSLSKCCRKQSYWQNQSARHARARSSKTSRLSLEITVPCLEMVRRRSFLFGMACFLGSSKR